MRFMSPSAARLPAVAVGLSLVLAACGSAGSTAAPSGTTGASAPPAASASPAAEEISIGVLLGLTGLAPETGEAARVAVSTAEKEINDAGGIGGRPVRLVIADTESDPTQATLEVSRLLDTEGVEAMIGPMFSQESLAVLPVLSEREVFNIHQTGAVELTPELGKYSFGILMNAGAVARKMVEYTLDDLSPGKVAIVHDPGAQALSAVKIFTEELQKANVGITATVQHDYGVTDMAPVLLQATRDNPEIIVLFQSNGGDLGNFLKARAELGRTSIPVVANNVAGAVQQVALDVAGGDEAIFEGVTGVTASSFATCDENAGGSPLDFKESVTTFLGEEPKFALTHASLFYDALYIIKAAIEGSDGATDGPTLRDWMYENIGSFESVYSNLQASPESHFLVGLDALAIIKPLPILPGGMTLRVDC